MNDFLTELKDLINRHSRENKSNTPDFILAEWMYTQLELLEVYIKERERWYGGRLQPAMGKAGPWVEPDETGMYPTHTPAERDK